MKYKYLGKSDLKISQIGLGSYFSFADRLNEEESKKIILKAGEIGINFLDTANTYANGNCELCIGKILKKINRKNWILATKLFWPDPFDPKKIKGLKKEYLIKNIEYCLKRLQTDYIDLLQCHRYDRETPLEETMYALEDLTKKGKVRYIGVTNWSAQQVENANKILDNNLIISNQLPFSFLHQKFKSDFQLLKDKGIGTIAYAALAQGIISKSYVENKHYSSSRYFHKIAQEQLWHNNSKDLKKVIEFNKASPNIFESAITYVENTVNPDCILLGCYKDKHLAEINQYVNIANHNKK